MITRLKKLFKPVSKFLRHSPSVSGLRRSRHPSFESLHLIAPSIVQTGEQFSVKALSWDSYGRLYPLERGFTVKNSEGFSREIEFEDETMTRFTTELEEPGIHYFVARSGSDVYVSNPVKATSDEPGEKLYWGDIHLHSGFSDGVSTPGKGFEYGRDVMDLDVVAYTDHDTMGFFIPPALQLRRMRKKYFQATKEAVEQYHEPGEFVTLMGYEWTHQPNKGSHINVYFEDTDGAELYSSRDPESDSPEKLWKRIDEWETEHDSRTLTAVHHSPSEMFPFDFGENYDEEKAPVVEVYSRWGSSEHPDTDLPIEMGQGRKKEKNHYVQGAFERGLKAGMIGGSDHHGPYPGHSLIHEEPHLPSWSELRDRGLGWGNIWRIWDEPSYPGGLTGFYAPELSREAILDSLETRAAYATTQPHRILVDFRVNDTRFGENDSETRGGTAEISFQVAGTAPIEKIEVVRDNQLYEQFEPEGAGLDRYTVKKTVVDEEPGKFYYLRVKQEDSGRAWAGPIWMG